MKEWGGHCYELKHQKVHWTIDFAKRQLRGQTELHLATVGDVSEIRLNSRQLIISKAEVDLVEPEKPKQAAATGPPKPFTPAAGGGGAAAEGEDADDESAAALKMVKTRLDSSYTVSDYTRGIIAGKPTAGGVADFKEALKEQTNLADQGELIVKLKRIFKYTGYLAKDRRLIVRISFKIADPILGGIHFVCPRDGYFTDRPEHMFTTANVCESRLFMPCMDTFGDDKQLPGTDIQKLRIQTPTWELVYTVPEDMVVVSAGELQEQVARPGGKKSYVYAVETPTPSYRIGFAVGPFEVLPDPKNPEQVTHFCLPGLKSQLAHTIAVYSFITDFAKRVLATDFPFPSHQLVFVDEEPAPLRTYSGMSMISTNLLSSSRIIDKTFEARELLARAVMMQYFGASVIPRARGDVWLTLGIAGYLTGLFLEETFGRNEYRHYTYRKHEAVCKADAEWDHSHKEQRHRPLITEKHNHVSEYFSQFAQDKSECVLRIMEGRLGQENLLEILTRMSEVKEDELGDVLPCMVAYKDFLAMANERVPQRWKELLQNWVECEGFAHFAVTLIYNSSAPRYLTVKIVQNVDKQADIFRGNIKVGVQEVDAYVEHIIRIDGKVKTEKVQLKSRNNRGKRKKVRLENDQEVEIDLASGTGDAFPFLWVRVDPNFEWLRKIEIKMTRSSEETPKGLPVGMLAYEAEYGRHVGTQIEAVSAMGAVVKDSDKALATLKRIVKDPKHFWRVQGAALNTMPVVVNPARVSKSKEKSSLAGRVGGGAAGAAGGSTSAPIDRGDELANWYIEEFSRRYGVPSNLDLPRPNDFSNLLEYYIQRALVRSIACIRNASNLAPQKVFGFLLNTYKLNNNDDNRFDDGYYQAEIITAITEAITGKIEKTWNAETKKIYNGYVNVALQVLTYAVNVDKLTPTFQQAVTHAAINGIWKLQACKAIESQPQFFIDHALYGHNQHIRFAAIKCLAELAQTHPDALMFLLELGQNDYVPSVRTHALKEIAKAARIRPVGVFLKSDDSDGTAAVIRRVWDVMNLGSAFEIDLRVAALQCFGAILPAVRESSDVTSLARGVRVNSSQIKMRVKSKGP